MGGRAGGGREGGEGVGDGRERQAACAAAPTTPPTQTHCAHQPPPPHTHTYTAHIHPPHPPTHLQAYLDVLLEDCGRWGEGLQFMRSLGRREAAAALQKYGRVSGGGWVGEPGVVGWVGGR